MCHNHFLFSFETLANFVVICGQACWKDIRTVKHILLQIAVYGKFFRMGFSTWQHGQQTHHFSCVKSFLLYVCYREKKIIVKLKWWLLQISCNRPWQTRAICILECIPNSWKLQVVVRWTRKLTCGFVGENPKKAFLICGWSFLWLQTHIWKGNRDGSPAGPLDWNPLEFRRWTQRAEGALRPVWFQR